MRRTFLILIALSTIAAGQERGAVKLDKPYKWELKSVPSYPVGRLFRTQANVWLGLGTSHSSFYSDISGRVTSLAVDPENNSLVYACAADGGLWKSTDAGTTWSPLTDDLPRLSSGAVAVDPKNSNVIYYGTGELNFNIDGYPGSGLYKSTDGGMSWNPISENVVALYYTSKIVVAPSNDNVVYAAGYSGLYKSTDAGTTWNILPLTHGAVDDIAVDPQNASTIYASYGSGFSYDSTSYGIHKSTDGGASWTWLGGGLPPASQIYRASLAIAPSNNQILYAAINGNNPSSSGSDTNRVYVSTNAGASWQVLPSVTSKSDFGGTQGWYNNVIAIDPSQPNTVYLGGIDFWKSTDGGQTWTNLTNGYGSYTGKNIHPDQHAIAFANSSTFYIGNDGGVWKTTNAASSFTNCNADLQTTQFYDIAIDPNNSSVTIGGSQDNGTQSNSQPATNWEEVYGGDGGYVLVDPTNSKTIYSEYVNGALLKSTNGGSSFSSITSGIGEKGYWIEPYVLDPTNPATLYTGTSKMYKSTNGGSSWTSVSGTLTSGAHLVTTMAISPVEPNVVYAGLSGYRGAADTSYLFISTDAGNSWNNLTGKLTSGTDFARITADPTHKGTVYIANLVGLTSHVLRSTDYGQTWTGLDSTGNGFANVPAKVIAIDSLTGNIFVGTYQGLYRSTDNGATWSLFGTGLPNSVIDAIAIQYASDVLRVGTHGRGAWQVNMLTGIASPAVSPTTFALGQNYPNPFNPSTTVRYSIPQAASVTVEVYNILGQQVRILQNGFQPAGIHSVSFDASRLPSGVYFCTIRFQGTSITKKMMLLK